MLHKKYIKQKILAGWNIRDLQTFEPDRSCNGGHYYKVYRLATNGQLYESSSYEDADWEDGDSIESLVDYIHQTQNDPCWFGDWPRWEFVPAAPFNPPY